MAEKNTSWGAVANWYDDLLEDSADSYQKNVIMPNLIRLVDPKKGMTILDVACGQGYFARAFAENGATVTGCDVSAELIELARAPLPSRRRPTALEPTKVLSPVSSSQFHVASSDKLLFAADSTVDIITIVLALQNIENLSGTLAECSRVSRYRF